MDSSGETLFRKFSPGGSDFHQVLSMEIDQHLAALAQKDPEARRNALRQALHQEGIPYSCQQQEDPRTRRLIENYLVYPDGEDPCPMFCAHYDARPGSVGANDNAASLCILIALARACRAEKLPAAFCFLDGEEEDHLGAKLLEENRTRRFSLIVNLDMCGYGDTLALWVKGGQRKPAAARFLEKDLLRRHGVRRIGYMPEGDDRCFSTGRQPVFSIAVMPYWDTRFLDAIAAHGSLLGQAPEVPMILGEMEVMTTMHGGWKDQVKWIQPEAMEKVYNYLWDALHQQGTKKQRHWGL